LALFFALLSLFVIPVDVYFANSLSDYSSTRDEMMWVYYGFDIVLLCFVFAILPFAYFMYEELGDYSGRRNEGPRWTKRACSSIKYTLGFVFVFVVLIIIGAFINFDNSGSSSSSSSDSTSSWKSNVVDNFNGQTSRIVPFCLAVLMCVGLFLAMVYTSWGLASLPISLMRSMRVTYDSMSESKRKSKGGKTVTAEIDEVRNEIDYLDTKYLGKEDEPWEKADKDKKKRLLAKQKVLEYKMNRGNDSGKSSGRNSGKVVPVATNEDNSNVCCALIWNGSAPIRYVIGLILLAWGALVVVCMAMHLVDESMNSSCGYSCGFQVETYKWPIPLEVLLSEASKVFPLDYVLFAAIILWLFIATIAGVAELQVRVLCFKLFRFQARATVQNALILAVGFIIVIAASFTYLMMTLAPHYTSYGNQSTNCSNTTCRATAIYYILTGIEIGMPVFGLIYFVFSWIFVLVFILSLLRNTCRRPTRPGGYERAADDGLEDEFRD